MENNISTPDAITILMSKIVTMQFHAKHTDSTESKRKISLDLRRIYAQSVCLILGYLYATIDLSKLSKENDPFLNYYIKAFSERFEEVDYARKHKNNQGINTDNEFNNEREKLFLKYLLLYSNELSVNVTKIDKFKEMKKRIDAALINVAEVSHRYNSMFNNDIHMYTEMFNTGYDLGKAQIDKGLNTVEEDRISKLSRVIKYRY